MRPRSRGRRVQQFRGGASGLKERAGRARRSEMKPTIPPLSTYCCRPFSLILIKYRAPIWALFRLADSMPSLPLSTILQPMLDSHVRTYCRTELFDVLFLERHVQRDCDYRRFRGGNASRVRTNRHAARARHRRGIQHRRWRVCPVALAKTVSLPRCFWRHTGLHAGLRW